MTPDLDPLTRALASLERGLLRWQATPADEELRDACIQRFELTFELCWKTLKRRLESDLPNPQEVDAMSFRTLLRVGAEQGLVGDVKAWWVHRDKRNLTTHTYNAAVAADVAASIPKFAADAAELLAALRRKGELDA